jgi:hypothetical protein
MIHMYAKLLYGPEGRERGREKEEYLVNEFLP